MLRHILIEDAVKGCKQKINVTDFGADPSGQLDSTEAIWQAFESAKAMEGQVVIDFPYGTYQLQKGSSQVREYHTSNTDSMRFPHKPIALLLEDQQDVIINGNGSLFMINGDCMALAVVRSKNVTLNNFSWDYSVPTTIEMTVMATGEVNGEQFTDFSIPVCFSYSVDEDGRNVNWYSEIDPKSGKHYWTDRNHKDAWVIVVYHPDRNITRRYSPDAGPFSEARTKIIQLNESTIRIFYGKDRPILHQKDLVFTFCSTQRRDTAGAFIWESSDTVVEKVNVHYMHGFGWLTQLSHNVSFYNCSFKTREERGLFTSSFADSIHVSGASGHVHIEGCSFKLAHDDPINVHGTFTRVEERIDERTLKLRYIHRQQGGFPQYYRGNEVVFYRRDTLTPICREDQRYTVTAVKHPGEDDNDLQSMIVSFDQEIPNNIIEKEDGESLVVAENVTYTPTVHIKNNHFEAIPTRGILCTTSRKVLIEQNTFKHMTMDGIFISNDSQDWYESGPVRDVTIRSNTFYVAEVGHADWRNAAIRIFPVTKGNQIPPSEQAIHRNIRIEQNEFYMENESVLVVNSVKQLLFRNNTIHLYTPEIDTRFAKTEIGGENKGNADKHTFEFNGCQDVIIEVNKFDEHYKPTLSYTNMPAENMKVTDMLEKFLNEE
ncbi:right-handed parallel beta-helix repeat-containing protein [Neobacillus kokaensis]|uniref:Pectate lyase superfamily protein domain-containing protein n=1 Tax=Neobacillus kokaensis TaxID=2759023 RepID=A0ABQ3MYS5_9BACI|nr:right-handed parallel beta-helix repeat-containing protein [Neobacillus kokaensis]GHH97820.1 hypothetical protein AM1BK_13630 [Neobacillus kokaensis]